MPGYVTKVPTISTLMAVDHAFHCGSEVSVYDLDDKAARETVFLLERLLHDAIHALTLFGQRAQARDDA